MDNGNDILKRLHDAKTMRHDMYLNEKRINELFRQRVSRINKWIVSSEFGPEFSANLAIFGIKVGGKQGLSAEYELAPADKALLIELTEQEHGSLRNVDDSIPTGSLIRFVDKGGVTQDYQEVTAKTTLLPVDLAPTVQKERKRQEGPDKSALVWTWKNQKYLAAIAFEQSVVDASHAVSFPKAIYGILGRKESELENLIFIAPIWIWYEPDSPPHPLDPSGIALSAE